MKNIFFLLLFMFNYIITFSQNTNTNEDKTLLVNFSNKWNMLIRDQIRYDTSSYFYKFGGDSLNENYKYFFLKGVEELGELEVTDIYLRQEEKKVWQYYEEGEKLLYDFSLEKGDTFQSKIFNKENVALIVSEIDSVQILDGSMRKRMKLYCKDDPDTINHSYYGLRTWIDGIGDLGGVLSVKSSCSPEQNSALLCFYYNYRLRYSNPMFSQCWYSGTDDIVDAGIKIFPNPVRDYLIIKLDNISKYQGWEIFNLLGQKVMSGKFDYKYQIDVAELDTGLYFLLILKNTEILLTSYFIKL